MDSIRDILEEILAIITLVIPALESLANSNPSNFWFWIFVALLISLGMYLLVLGAGRLSLKGYRLTKLQHLSWVVNSLFSGAAIIVWVVGQNLAPGLALVLLAWQHAINDDQNWANETYMACYQAVKDLHVEDFSNFPPPGPGVRTSIPVNQPESQMALTRVMTDRAAVHFATSFPALGRLLDVADRLDTPSSELKVMVEEFFKQTKADGNGKKFLPQTKSIEMCSDILRETFNSRVESLQSLVLFVSIAVPSAAWLLLLTWVLCRSRRLMSGLIKTIQPT